MCWHYEVRDLASLPRVRGITGPPCMAGPWWLRRIRRAATGRDCCWHHGVNWHLVSETAIGIALQAQASGTSPEDAFDALDLAACGLAGDDRTGLTLLLGPGAGIELDDEDPSGAELKFLNLAASFAVIDQPVNLYIEVTSGLDSAHARRLAEAVLIATGAAGYLAVAPVSLDHPGTASGPASGRSETL